MSAGADDGRQLAQALQQLCDAWLDVAVLGELRQLQQHAPTLYTAVLSTMEAWLGPCPDCEPVSEPGAHSG